MKYIGGTNEYLQIESIDHSNCQLVKEVIPSALTLIWFEDDNSQLTIDSIQYDFKKNQIVCLTEFHKISVNKVKKARLIRFTKAFYCILNHDNEVSCKGILFFGANQLPILSIPTTDLKVFNMVYDMFLMEFETQDNLQLEMLQMMLKRFIILCARVYKAQHQFDQLDNKQADIVREYNFLVEQHYKTKHTVSEYAELLFKSPKTLSNLFSKLGAKTPLQFIQERKMLEARRQLSYTHISIKELAYELGFEDLQTFSRFFKNNEKISPSEFREKHVALM